jgi:hypothetical protein
MDLYLIALTPLLLALTAACIAPIGLHYADKERAERRAKQAIEVPAEIPAFRRRFALSGEMVAIDIGAVTISEEVFRISGQPEQSERPKQPVTAAGRPIAA